MTHLSRSTLLGLLLVLLWAFQLRFPPLSYPAIGLLVLVLLSGLSALCAVWVHQAHGDELPADEVRRSTRILSHPALLPGGLLLGWIMVRWVWSGLSPHATDDVMTWAWAAVYFAAAFMLYRLAAMQGEQSRLSEYALKMLCLAGVVSGGYAILQYHHLYHQAHAALIEAIGNREPDRTEAALLHHLSLRRVASFLGDPNSYAAFAAIAVAASFEIMSSERRRKLIWRITAAVSIAVSLCGIYYTGSRGGVLDVLGVVALFAIIWTISRRNASVGRSVAVWLLLPLLLFVKGVPAQVSTAAANATTAQPESNWFWRSDTIRERLYYLDVGAKMIKMAPVIGVGPGSVNDYFGRFKSPNAREARHLHNWPVNVLAEYGIIGLSLLLWYLAPITRPVLKHRLWQAPWLRGHFVILLVMLFDGLLQTSWAQRELMSLLGLSLGCLAGTVPPRNDPGDRWRLHGTLLAFLALVAVLLVVDVRYLSAKNHKTLASDALSAGELTLAQRHASQASMWAPRDPEPYQLRGHVALMSGNTAAARQLLEKALRLSPESASLNSQLANIYKVTRQANLEERHIQRALELYPSHPQYNLQYAEYLQRQGNITEAMRFASLARKYSYLEDEQQTIDEFIRQLKSAGPSYL